MSDIKQLCIISGKGGTGKTTLTAAFASLAESIVLADCDIDAADLHLILKPNILKKEEFSGMKMAVIDEDKCEECGECITNCRFEAIGENYEVAADRCEGCGVCLLVCPTSAVDLIDRKSGWLYASETRFGPMAHAELNIAEEASGKLVAAVRQNATKLAEQHNKDRVIIDGPPGIGCPVISSISGVDLVLIVTEPTVAGVSDLERILGVAFHFKIKAAVCINKYDLNLENTKKIEEFCSEEGLDIIGKLSYSDIPTKSMLEEQTVIEYEQERKKGSKFSADIKMVWNNLREIMGGL